MIEPLMGAHSIEVAFHSTYLSVSSTCEAVIVYQSACSLTSETVVPNLTQPLAAIQSFLQIDCEGMINYT